jgi:5-(carboxyamino)imidazole ribonucleotide synthase
VNRAIDYTSTLANSLDVHGLLAVEYFLTHDNKIIFNEMAPRPHNSGHLTIECSYTSQFEQLIRAACNLPWGSPIIHSPGEMKNILGNEIENYTHLMISDDELSVHIYGKGAPAPGRKMGHSVRHLN